MSSNALGPPPQDSSASDLADWLELRAFFDTYEEARLDEIDAAFQIQQEDAQVDIGEADAELERRRAALESEIEFRAESLGDAYPFELSDTAEVLELKAAADRRGGAFYLLCLVLSHVTRSPILLTPPSDAHLRDVRKKYFQTLSTFAVAGHSLGGALSLGWPRASGESILEVVARACHAAGTGKPRERPASTANPAAKDGGIDVLSWTPENDRPPPKSFVFAQAASGHGWPDKTARMIADEFMRDYFDEWPTCDYEYVTICPFRVPDEEMRRVSWRHGAVLDRTRAPYFALRGLERAANDQDVDELDRACGIALWLSRYRAEVRLAS